MLGGWAYLYFPWISIQAWKTPLAPSSHCAHLLNQLKKTSTPLSLLSQKVRRSQGKLFSLLSFVLRFTTISFLLFGSTPVISISVFFQSPFKICIIFIHNYVVVKNLHQVILFNRLKLLYHFFIYFFLLCSSLTHKKEEFRLHLPRLKLTSIWDIILLAVH